MTRPVIDAEYPHPDPVDWSRYNEYGYSGKKAAHKATGEVPTVLEVVTGASVREKLDKALGRHGYPVDPEQMHFDYEQD